MNKYKKCLSVSAILSLLVDRFVVTALGRDTLVIGTKGWCVHNDDRWFVVNVDDTLRVAGLVEHGDNPTELIRAHVGSTVAGNETIREETHDLIDTRLREERAQWEDEGHVIQELVRFLDNLETDLLPGVFRLHCRQHVTVGIMSETNRHGAYLIHHGPVMDQHRVLVLEIHLNGHVLMGYLHTFK